MMRFPGYIRRDRVAAAVLALVLAAYTGQGGTGPPTTGAISSAPMSEAFVSRISSAGPITPANRFSQVESRRLYPGKQLQTTRIADDERTFHALSVCHNDLQTIAIEPTSNNAHIKAAHWLGPDVSGPNGGRIGMRFGELRVNPANCRVGQKLWRGMPVRKAAETSNVLLMFNPGEPDFAYQVRMPPRDVLRQASLRRNVWLPG